LSDGLIVCYNFNQVSLSADTETTLGGSFEAECNRENCNINILTSERPISLEHCSYDSTRSEWSWRRDNQTGYNLKVQDVNSFAFSTTD